MTKRELKKKKMGIDISKAKMLNTHFRSLVTDFPASLPMRLVGSAPRLPLNAFITFVHKNEASRASSEATAETTFACLCSSCAVNLATRRTPSALLTSSTA
jgi:hypothetical protein